MCFTPREVLGLQLKEYTQREVPLVRVLLMSPRAGCLNGLRGKPNQESSTDTIKINHISQSSHLTEY